MCGVLQVHGTRISILTGSCVFDLSYSFEPDMAKFLPYVTQGQKRIAGGWRGVEREGVRDTDDITAT